MNEKLKRGCVVFMKASSGLIGYGNAQCISDVHGAELGTISLYGHNQHYKTYDIDKIVEYPKLQAEVEMLRGIIILFDNYCRVNDIDMEQFLKS